MALGSFNLTELYQHVVTTFPNDVTQPILQNLDPQIKEKRELSAVAKTLILSPSHGYQGPARESVLFLFNL